MANRDNFKKGSIEMLLLFLLQEGDLYGYQLSQIVKQRSEGIIIVPEGSMYPTLYRLLEKGCITDYKKQVGKRLTRVYYHLESEGVKYLHSLLDNYYKINNGIQLLLNYQEGAAEVEKE